MIKLTFLKLDGLRGPSFAPRHIGDFEVSSFTFSNQPIIRGGPKTLAQAMFNHLVVYKRSDATSQSIRLAWTKEQVFATGELIVEEVSAAGQLIRTTAYKMRSVVLDSVSSFRYEDTIALKFESMTVH